MISNDIDQTVEITVDINGYSASSITPTTPFTIRDCVIYEYSGFVPYVTLKIFDNNCYLFQHGGITHNDILSVHITTKPKDPTLGEEKQVSIINATITSITATPLKLEKDAMAFGFGGDDQKGYCYLISAYYFGEDNASIRMLPSIANGKMSSKKIIEEIVKTAFPNSKNKDTSFFIDSDSYADNTASTLDSCDMRWIITKRNMLSALDYVCRKTYVKDDAILFFIGLDGRISFVPINSVDRQNNESYYRFSDISNSENIIKGQDSYVKEAGGANSKKNVLFFLRASDTNCSEINAILNNKVILTNMGGQQAEIKSALTATLQSGIDVTQAEIKDTFSDCASTGQIHENYIGAEQYRNSKICSFNSYKKIELYGLANAEEDCGKCTYVYEMNGKLQRYITINRSFHFEYKPKNISTIMTTITCLGKVDPASQNSASSDTVQKSADRERAKAENNKKLKEIRAKRKSKKNKKGKNNGK